jgi:mersacidin/lichenicidin family type 2 lantibiotic
MSQVNIVRAWKDEEYRHSLAESERARLPENPAGLLEQTEAELERAAGGFVIHSVSDCNYLVGTTALTGLQGSIACTTNGVLTVSAQTVNQYGFGG